jgi:sugar transferase (PEP-CTERM system associated)
MIRIFSQYVSVKSFLLAALETVLIVLSVLAAVRLRFWNNATEWESFVAVPNSILQVVLVVVVFEICFYYNDLYDLSAVTRRVEQFVRLGQALGAACLFLGFAYYLLPDLLIGRGVFFLAVGLVIASVIANRVLLDAAWRFSAPVHNVLILGVGEVASSLIREFRKRPDLNMNLVGLIDRQPAGPEGSNRVFGQDVIGTSNDLAKIARERNISRIIVAMEDFRGALPARELVKLRVEGVRIEDAHTALACLTGRVWLHTVRPSWFVFSEGFHRSHINALVKRAVDLSLSLLGFLFSLPVMLLVAAAIRLDSKGPLLYRQTRVGWKARPFKLLKFRSMRIDAESVNGAQWAQEDDPRATRVGKYLRKFRLDELPQFVNVLRGEMSFVGPRPERPEFVEKLREAIPFYDERHSVRPGITGWAQVQYRYGASVEDSYRKLEYDLFYLKNMSFFFDCAIVLQTVRIVLFGHGAR